jgi:hypothetical protein
MWLLILFCFTWPLLIPWGFYCFICYLAKSYCSDCKKIFFMKNVNEIVTRSYWEKACLDGTPDFRYKSNSKV